MMYTSLLHLKKEQSHFPSNILLHKMDSECPFSNTVPLSNCNNHPHLRQAMKKIQLFY